MKQPKLIIGLQVYNEQHRFLTEWVGEVNEYADSLVALDDCSTDGTVGVLLEGFRNKPIVVARAQENLFNKNELLLRKWLWAMLKMEAHRLEEQGFTPWILMLDADEIMEEKFKRDVPLLLSDSTQWFYGLKFCHFWRSRDVYRVDKLWKPSFGPRLIRYDHGHVDKWRNTPLHCGSLPLSLWTRKGRPGKNVDYIIKHLGYVLSPEEKHERYAKLDPRGDYAPKSHYDSMLDPNPALVEWKERV